MSRFAVVGAGASGTIQALHLLRSGAEKVVLIERERVPARGTAYGTSRPEHLLNVPARRMIVYPDDPNRFAQWWEERGGSAEGYAPRMAFGDYLEEELAAARERIEIVPGEAADIVRAGAGETVRLAGGGAVAADAAILALGNLRPAVPRPIDPQALGPVFVGDPWYGRFAEGLSDADRVLLVGTGLTAIDAALTLEAQGFGGQILALSRRGLAPRAHEKRDPQDPPADPVASTSVALLRRFRRRSAEIGWRSAVHELRSATQAIWSAAPLHERRRFLRHLRPWWDVHRHRIAPAVAETIARMEAEGRLAFAAGRIEAADRAGGAAIVRWRPRGTDRGETLRAARIVNCTGPELDIARAGEPLLDALIAGGRIRSDVCRLGIEVDAACRTVASDGSPSDSLLAIGPITRGAFWESIAVPDISVQARDVALRLTA